MRQNWVCGSLLLLAFGWVLASPSPVEASARRLSPHGLFEVVFDTPPVEVITDPNQSLPAFRSHAARYSVKFFKPGTDTVLATTEFFDIYDASGPAKPRGSEKLGNDVIWSPEEDFAVLPPAQSGGANNTDENSRVAVSLNTRFPWQTAPFPLNMDSVIWIDATHVAGQWLTGCRQTVGEFDGSTGNVTALIDVSNALGYVIVNSTPQRIVAKKVFTSCAVGQDKMHFSPGCLAIDLRFMRQEIIACPAS